jgi:hypothetical protein
MTVTETQATIEFLALLTEKRRSSCVTLVTERLNDHKASNVPAFVVSIKVTSPETSKAKVIFTDITMNACACITALFALDVHMGRNVPSGRRNKNCGMLAPTTSPMQ